MKTPPPPYPGITKFLFETPLYTKFTLHENLEEVRVLYGRMSTAERESGRGRIDGFCPYCKRESTFEVNGIGIPSGDPWNKIKDRWAVDQLSITSEGLSITTLDISFKSKKW